MSVEAVFDSGEIGRRRPSPFALGLQEVVGAAIAPSEAIESAVMPRVAAQSVSRGKMTAEQLEARQLQRSEDDELIRAAQAWAYIANRRAVLPEDIQAVVPSVVAHRLERRESGGSGDSLAIAQELIRAVPVPL